MGLSESLRARLAPGMEESIVKDAALRGPETGREDMAAHRQRGASGTEFWIEGTPEPAAVEDHTYQGGGGEDRRLRLYRGRLPAPAPVLFYIHGGGWMSGSIEQNEPLVRALVDQTGWSVVSISYRLAPEHPFPAGLDDSVAAIGWFKEKAAVLGLDAGRVVIGGTSAGANLGLAALLRRTPSEFAGLLLFYGVFGADLETPSHNDLADAGLSLDRATMRQLFDYYYHGWEQAADPLFTPVIADLAGLPPSLLIAAELDVLLSDSELLHERMKEAGVPVELRIEKGVLHGFINRGRLVPAANESIAAAARFLTGLTNSK